MSLFRLWNVTPRPLRRIASRVIRALGLPVSKIREMAGHPEEAGFVTLSPDTPPAITKSLQYVKNAGIQGDYYEFGMFKGYCFWHAQSTARRFGISGMRYWGFDSFAGLPRTDETDSGKDFKERDYACTREQVSAYLSKFGFDWSKASLIEGYYDQSLRPELKQQLGMKPVAVALIDCDLYASTVQVLGFIADLLQDGSILLFDDWNCFGASDEMGERRAMCEFLEANPRWRSEPFISFGWHGQSFIMRRS